MFEHLKDLQSILDWHKERGSLLVIDKEIDWKYEISGVIKKLEEGPALLFTNIKGYPGMKIASNIFSSRKTISDMLGIEGGIEYTGRHFMEKGRECISPRIVDSAPSQENVITGGNIDFLKILPVPMQNPNDAGRIITSGIAMVKIPETGGFNISFHRMNPREPNASSLNVLQGRHLLDVLLKARKVEKRNVPVTINIGGPPTQIIMAAGGTQSTFTPYGYDELALAGALQGAPIEIVPAKTIEGAWSIANASFVLEGYVDWRDTTLECEAEDDSAVGKRMFMAEYHGCFGFSWRVFKFVCTGITHRNNPIYYFPIADSLEGICLCSPCVEAAVYDTCKKIDPTVFDTCYVLHPMRGVQGIVLRINKRKKRDEGMQVNMMMAALGAQGAFQWVIAVDQDIDITSTDDVLWALIFRSDMKNGLTVLPGSRVEGTFVSTAHSGVIYRACFDATVPLENQWYFKRPNFPYVDLEKFISKETIEKIRCQQSDYAKMLSTRWTTLTT